MARPAKPALPPREADVRAVPLRHPGRVVAAVVLVGLLGLFLWGAATNSAYQWPTYRKYLFDRRILEAVWNTVQLTALAMAIAVALGVALAIMRLSANPVLRWVAWGYVWVFRGTPVYVQLVFWGLLPGIYKQIDLGIPFVHQFAHIELQGLSAYFILAVIGLGLNEAAYMAEIVRTGIESVGAGQVEASLALGMTRGLLLRRVVLPQAMRVILPPSGNELISLLKTTSLVTAVPYSYDLYSRAHEVATLNFQPIPLLLVAATWYLAVTTVLMIVQHFLERYVRKGVARGV